MTLSPKRSMSSWRLDRWPAVPMPSVEVSSNLSMSSGEPKSANRSVMATFVSHRPMKGSLGAIDQHDEICRALSATADCSASVGTANVRKIVSKSTGPSIVCSQF